MIFTHKQEYDYRAPFRIIPDKIRNADGYQFEGVLPAGNKMDARKAVELLHAAWRRYGVNYNRKYMIRKYVQHGRCVYEVYECRWHLMHTGSYVDFTDKNEVEYEVMRLLVAKMHRITCRLRRFLQESPKRPLTPTGVNTSRVLDVLQEHMSAEYPPDEYAAWVSALGLTSAEAEWALAYTRPQIKVLQ